LPRAERHSHHFSVLLLDLDDFKEINDSYSHPIGDNVLIKIARTICSRLRKGDIPVRMGGGEFAVILPETQSDGAIEVAESLRNALHELLFDAPGDKHFRISASIGGVSYPKDAQTVADLMTGVDIALYRAKEHGKNEVCASTARNRPHSR
jgi:diguanylate cyclase (GGDEF)-like protein